MNLYSLIFVASVVIFQVSANVHYVKLHQDEQFACKILDENPHSRYKGFRGSKSDGDENELHVKISPAVHVPKESKVKIHDESKIVQIFAKTEAVAKTHVSTLCKSTSKIVPPIIPADLDIEIRKLVDGGYQGNRIDVAFMGDGYQLNAKNQFFEDIQRLTDDMFTGTTFRSYLPLFNVWAIYHESVDSGIGYNGPQDTPFKLYREAGQLRVIWPGDPNYARSVCTMLGFSACEYPSLIGNDDFYGGLGGEFVVSTKSNRTGTVVLRHEMGHNFAAVGDEYDNSWAYFGANNAQSLESVGWTHWLSTDGPAREERAMYRLLEYPWADLDLGSKTFTFTSDGTFSRWYLLLSVSAAGEEDSLEFLLDGNLLPWATRGSDDREFYDWFGGEPLTSGSHNFTVRSKTSPTHPDIPRMICSVILHELGSPNEYHTDNDYFSAYPTWDDSAARVKTYRPTNAGCLMRNMSHNEFCHVCKESMWLEFLEQISMIDSVDVSETGNPDGTKNVTLYTIKLGQLREPGNEVIGERLEVRWFWEGFEMAALRDRFKIEAVVGTWSVRVQLITPEVRVDPREYLREEHSFTVV